MSKVLITGASGFLGYHLTRQLVERGHQVTGLVRPTSDVTLLEPLQIKLVQGDVSVPDSLQPAFAGQEIVFHLAGLTKAKRATQFDNVNAIGAQNVAAACQSLQTPPILLHVSSLSAAGPTENGSAKTEEAPAKPVSHYGRSKLHGELAMRASAHHFPITIVRPPMVFGEADPAFVNIIRPLKRFGVHAVPGLKPKAFSLIHASDLVAMMITAAEKGERLSTEPERFSHGIYFIEAERRLNYDELGTEFAKTLQKKVRVLKLPHAAVWLLAAAAQIGQELGGRTMLGFDKAREATAGSWICSAEKARDQLGFAPAKPLSERMQETVNWYLSHGWL